MATWSKSGYFPWVLGVLLMVAAGAHLVEVATHLLFPAVGQGVILLIQLPAVVAEFWMLGYLLVKGVRVADSDADLVEAPVA